MFPLFILLNKCYFDKEKRYLTFINSAIKNNLDIYHSITKLLIFYYHEELKNEHLLNCVIVKIIHNSPLKFKIINNKAVLEDWNRISKLMIMQ